MVKKETQKLILRWIALFSLLANIFFNYYTNAFPLNGQTVGDVSNEYPTLFTPAGYAFSIWGLIYLTLLIYAVYQLLPDQRKNNIYERLSLPFIFINIFSILWLVLFIYEYMAVSTIAIIMMLICAIFLYGKSKEMTLSHKVSQWVTIPFGLYLGWLSVATIANISILLSSIGWNEEMLGETTWAIIILTITFMLALFISWKFSDTIYPMVVVWAFFAIYVARIQETQPVATAAIIYAVLLCIWVVLYGIWLYKNKKRAFVL